MANRSKRARTGHSLQENLIKKPKTTNTNRTTATDTNTDPLISVKECQIRTKETVKVKDVYWVNMSGGPPCLGEVQTILRAANGEYKASIMWYTKAAPLGCSIAKDEYVVIEDKTDIVPVGSLANKVCILDWDAYNQVADNSKYLFHRMRKVKEGDKDDEKAYRCSRITECHESSPDANELLEKRLLCACGCAKHLIVDEGYTYCHGCKQSTQDAHLGQRDQYILVKNGFIYLVDKRSGKEQTANCKCEAPLTSKTATYRFGPPSIDPSLPRLDIACDAGTESFRVLCSIDTRLFFTEYPSCVFIPKGDSVTGEKLPLAIGQNKPGEEGEVIVPLKRLVFPDKTTEETLSGANLKGPQVFAESIRTLIQRSVEDELARDIPHTPATHLFDNYHVTISTAYPCCLDSMQKSIFLSALRGSWLRARIVAAPEPVTAVYAILKTHDLAPGPYTALDVGATTLDGTVVSVTHDKDIVVHSAFGIEIGADFPEMRTAEYLLTKTEGRNLMECLHAVRTYGRDIKQPGTRAEVPSQRFGVDIKTIYDEKSEEYYQRVRSGLNAKLSKPEHAQARNSLAILLCGGGARSPKLREIVEEILPKKTVQLYDASAKYSQVLNGCMQKLDSKYNIQYSPITICLECDRERSGTELLVIVLTDQALDGPKLLNAQQKPGQLIILDTQLGTTDARLTIKGRYGPTKTTVNAKGNLIADPAAKQSFYSIGEIYVSKDVWSIKGKSKGAKSALTLLSVHIDINGSVVLCDTLLIERPGTEELMDEIENLTIQQLRNRTGDYTIIVENNLAGSLDLHEIKEMANIPEQVSSSSEDDGCEDDGSKA